MTTAIEDALNAAKTVITNEIQGVSPAAVYVQPADSASISLNSLPIVVLMQNIFVEYNWQGSGNGNGRHNWEIMAQVYLEKRDGINPFSPDAATALALHDDWIKAMADVLRANMTLNGTVLHIGDGQTIFRYLVGNFQWNATNYWGIAFRIPVSQLHTQTVSA